MFGRQFVQMLEWNILCDAVDDNDDDKDDNSRIIKTYMATDLFDERKCIQKTITEFIRAELKFWFY